MMALLEIMGDRVAQIVKTIGTQAVSYVPNTTLSLLWFMSSSYDAYHYVVAGWRGCLVFERSEFKQPRILLPFFRLKKEDAVGKCQIKKRSFKLKKLNFL